MTHVRTGSLASCSKSTFTTVFFGLVNDLICSMPRRLDRRVGVVDLEVHFGDVILRLEEVLVAEVGFNVISPWTASERSWKTFLAKGGSRLYKGNKKSIKLVGAQRAWWAVSGSKKSPKRQSKGAVPMEIDSAF